MSPWFSFIISCLALSVSGVTAWLTFFRKGRLLMTQPTVIFFGPDGSKFDSKKNKIYLRTLLYSTAKRGQVLESLHVALHRNESKQNFNIWVYGEKGNLKRGSGLFVPQEGVIFDHHFLLPEDGANFNFNSGAYKLTVIAKLVGQSTKHELASIDLSISEAQALELVKPSAGIYFDWGPDQQSYHSHIETKPEVDPDFEQLLAVMANKKMQPTQKARG
ncbi:hypothetical protein Rhein_3047 [Rheinheimera sp. A13L]|uniref:hypothetical protein n=1 Tax=Rheinheimera sp. A13L TaxID=506534 RepID=UPI000212543F|nr:hypothetical protein Rhein_3047 [Rheinheimera sp. A13L]